MTSAVSAGPPAEIIRDIRAAAMATGVDFAYLVAKAGVESGFRADAKAATSSASGLYQFTEGTWLEMVKRHGAEHGYGAYADAISDSGGRLRVTDAETRREILALRDDPAASALFAGDFTAENSRRLEAGLGRRPDSTELYLAHFLGAGGALRFLRAESCDPASCGADLLPEAAAANRNVFFDRATGKARSLSDIRQFFNRRLESQPGAASASAEIPAAPRRAAAPPAEATAAPQRVPAAPRSGNEGFLHRAAMMLSADVILALAALELPGGDGSA
jgi:hypothetical protein